MAPTQRSPVLNRHDETLPAILTITAAFQLRGRSVKHAPGDWAGSVEISGQELRFQQIVGHVIRVGELMLFS